MFFRFVSAIVLVVLISVVGVALEKRNLELRRSVTRQHYQMDALYGTHARLRVLTHALGAPARLIAPVDSGELEVGSARQPIEFDRAPAPLLRFTPPPSLSW